MCVLLCSLSIVSHCCKQIFVIPPAFQQTVVDYCTHYSQPAPCVSAPKHDRCSFSLCPRTSAGFVPLPPPVLPYGFGFDTANIGSRDKYPMGLTLYLTFFLSDLFSIGSFFLSDFFLLDYYQTTLLDIRRATVVACTVTLRPQAPRPRGPHGMR